MLEQVVVGGDRRVKAAYDVADISAFRKAMPELIQQYGDQKEAAEHYAASVKAIAEKSGLKPAVIKKVVKAKVDDKLDEAKHEAEQLSMVFEEVG